MNVPGAISRIAQRVEELFIGVLLLAITGVIFLNVVMRYGFNSTLSWAEEFARYGVIWVTFIGASVCVARHLHIAIDVWGHKLSERTNRYWSIAVSAFCSVASVVFCWYSLQLVAKALQTGQKAIALGLPMWCVYGSMSLGSALMAVRFLVTIWQVIIPGANSITDQTRKQGTN